MATRDAAGFGAGASATGLVPEGTARTLLFETRCLFGASDGAAVLAATAANSSLHADDESLPSPLAMVAALGRRTTPEFSAQRAYSSGQKRLQISSRERSRVDVMRMDNMLKYTTKPWTHALCMPLGPRELEINTSCVMLASRASTNWRAGHSEGCSCVPMSGCRRTSPGH